MLVWLPINYYSACVEYTGYCHHDFYLSPFNSASSQYVVFSRSNSPTKFENSMTIQIGKNKSTLWPWPSTIECSSYIMLHVLHTSAKFTVCMGFLSKVTMTHILIKHYEVQTLTFWVHKFSVCGISWPQYDNWPQQWCNHTFISYGAFCDGALRKLATLPQNLIVTYNFELQKHTGHTD